MSTRILNETSFTITHEQTIIATNVVHHLFTIDASSRCLNENAINIHIIINHGRRKVIVCVTIAVAFGSRPRNARECVRQNTRTRCAGPQRTRQGKCACQNACATRARGRVVSRGRVNVGARKGRQRGGTAVAYARAGATQGAGPRKMAPPPKAGTVQHVRAARGRRAHSSGEARVAAGTVCAWRHTRHRRRTPTTTAPSRPPPTPPLSQTPSRHAHHARHAV